MNGVAINLAGLAFVMAFLQQRVRSASRKQLGKASRCSWLQLISMMRDKIVHLPQYQVAGLLC